MGQVTGKIDHSVVKFDLHLARPHDRTVVTRYRCPTALLPSSKWSAGLRADCYRITRHPTGQGGPLADRHDEADSVTLLSLTLPQLR